MNTEECHNFTKLVILYVVEKVLLMLGSLITVPCAKLKMCIRDRTSRWNDNKITMAHYKLNRSENLFSAH